MENSILLLIPLFPFIGFLFNGFLTLKEAKQQESRFTGLSSVVAVSMPVLSFLLSVYVFLKLASSHHERMTFSAFADWMVIPNALTVSFGLVADHLSALMLLFITGIGSLIHLYSTGYLKGEASYTRYFTYLNLFLFFMIVLVLADSLPLLFVGWEGVGLCSYLLIGFWFHESDKAKAGKKAFIANRVGDFAFLIAIFFIVAILHGAQNPLGQDLNTNYLNFSTLAQSVGQFSPALLTVITLLLFVAATGKSAQIPLYVWLPDAMAGPTPVSALIHAATMVTAGIYLIARLNFMFVLAPITLEVIAAIGACTALFSALIAVTQYDIKKVLAYSTVSQLGFMVMGLGASAFSASLFHVMTHAFFKACLFLGAGSVIHGLHHEQDIRKMGGLFKRMPITAITFLLATVAIAGIPPFSGFFSKDEILYMVYANAPLYVYIMAFLAAGLTAFYMTRLFVYVFLGKTRYEHPEDIHESPWCMTFPLIVLATLSVIGGWVGIPHLLGEPFGIHHYLGHWLEFLGQKTPHHLPGVLQESHLMLMSTVWAILACSVAFFLYKRDLNFSRRFKMKFHGVVTLVQNKFYIDELYEAVLIKPMQFISKWFLFKFVDVKIIDGFIVNGFAHIADLAGKALSVMQSGLLGHYLFYLFVAMMLLLTFLVF